jgi:filamentous hemagglutinin
MHAGLTTLDNTRLFAADYTNTPVEMNVHGFDGPIDAVNSERFGGASTWGEAVTNRIGNQNAIYRSLYPSGSPFVGIGQW